jgi:hypothetical protein
VYESHQSVPLTALATLGARDVQVPRAEQISIIAAPADDRFNQQQIPKVTRLFVFKHAIYRKFCAHVHEIKRSFTICTARQT